MSNVQNVSTPGIPVVCGIIRDALGRVLLAQHPQGKDLAGLWEFPGGKVESGESLDAALARELHEELGILAQIGRPIISIAHGRIRLEAIEVVSHAGCPSSREGQSLSWIALDAIDPDTLPEADRPILTALRLPDRYLITPMPHEGDEIDFFASLERVLMGGTRLIQLRLPGWSRDRVASVAREVRDRCRAYAASLLLSADWPLAEVLGLDGVHLPAHIAMRLKRRPVGPHRWLAVSCHNAAELAHAAAIGADFATLSPIRFTPELSDSSPLDWPDASELIAAATLPVFVLGGMQIEDIETSLALGGQGIAATRGLWTT